MQIFEPWLARWSLTPDGEPFETRYAKNWLMPVRQGDRLAMLKIATSEHEIEGAALMAWWAGEGAARVLAREGAALLLERLPAGRSLADLARQGDDDAATRILCDVARRLHAPRPRPAPASLYPLDVWLRALPPAASMHGGLFQASLTALEALLATPRDIAVMHGDLHHENVLDGEERGWLVIDPKGVLGERAYEFATLLCNPDEAMATAPGRLARQAKVIAETTGLDRERIIRWTLAHAGVSAAWCIADRFDPAPALAIGEIAKAELGL